MAYAYYNEIDPFCAEWLQNLIKKGLIADGVVDTRSITEVSYHDIKEFTQCHFFAGLGGWQYALRLAGWPDDRPVWTGSCPCQPFSVAGAKKGFTDDRHLWPVFYNLIQKCRPRIVFGEQVASADGIDWFSQVQIDLETAGYASAGLDLCAAGVGAPHTRQRIFWVGDSDKERVEGLRKHQQIIYPQRRQDAGRQRLPSAVAPSFWSSWESQQGADQRVREVPPGLMSGTNGSASRVGRLCAYGNAIVPQVAKEFIEAFMEYELSF